MAAFWAWFGVSWRAFWGVLQGISSSNLPLLDPITAWAWIELFQDFFGISGELFLGCITRNLVVLEMPNSWGSHIPRDPKFWRFWTP